MDNHWLPLLFPVRHHCLHCIWLDRLCTSGLNRTYPSWFVLWPASQSQISLVSLLAVRHGTFEMKLLVLAETQRSQMTIDVVAKLRTALLAMRVLSWLISNWSTKLFYWSWLKSLATLCMRYGLIPYWPLSNQRGRSCRSCHKTFHPFLLVI